MRRAAAYISMAILAFLTLFFAVWGPEHIARYRDSVTLNQVTVQDAGKASQGYQFVLDSNEKLFILSQCLNSQTLPESDLSSRTRAESEETDYGNLTGSYAFVMNRQGPTGKELTQEQIFETCNAQLQELKDAGVLPDEVKEISEQAYSAVLYSAIDVLEPRNNLSVWKISLSTNQQNADKSNRLLDAYVDADTGKIYEFYVRIKESWSQLDPDAMVTAWASYLELTGMEAYDNDNPLLENTPYYMKYRFAGMGEESTVVTIGFYEGINELFIKIAK